MKAIEVPAIARAEGYPYTLVFSGSEVRVPAGTYLTQGPFVLHDRDARVVGDGTR